VETLAYVAVASSNVVERYILNQDDPFNDEERESLELIITTTSSLAITYPYLGVLPPPRRS
jgi:hypothetical protein